MVKREIVIEVSGLTKKYGSFTAVDNLSFKVYKGEVFGFLGPNGAGKTSTIRMLNGLSKPTAGRATILGYDLATEITIAKKRIGVIPDISNLYDDLSAMDNLIFMAQLYGVPRAERRQRAEALLKQFGLYKRKNLLFGKFSKGMKRALTIASALIHKPEIIFLDEPTVGLDVVAARSLRAMLANLKKQGITIFLTTHYLEEADILCDRIALIVKGRIIKTDSPKGLKASVQTDSVIEFSFGKDILGHVAALIKKLSYARIEVVNQHKIRIHNGDSDAVYKAVVNYSAEKHLVIKSTHPVIPTLEDAFIKLTGLSSNELEGEEYEA